MKKTESKNSEEKKTTIVHLKQSADNGLKSKNLNPEPEKTLETNYDSLDGSGVGYRPGLGPSEWETKKIIPQMDEIIKNNDKFETIRVIMEILCKELGISVDSQFPTIAGAVQRVVQDYYKSMEDWKNLRKTAIKTDIRQ